MNSIRGVLLAAGKSTRFGNHFNKLLTPLCGIPLVAHIAILLESLHIPLTTVVGHLKEQVIATLNAHTTNATFVTQDEPLGTGHALLCSTPYWNSDHILVLNGDMPLITKELVEELIHTHTNTNAAVSFVAAYPDRKEHAYGRVIIENETINIVEAKDFKGDHTIAYPINAGIYIFKRSFLEEYAAELQPNNAQKQLYITDLIGIASKHRLGCNVIHTDYPTVHGVNTLSEFTKATETLRLRIIESWLNRGVLIEDPSTTWIDATVSIGEGTKIASGVHLRGTTTIGELCDIAQYCIIKDSILHEMVHVQAHSIIEQSTIHAHTTIKPFSHSAHETLMHANSGIDNGTSIPHVGLNTDITIKQIL